MPTSIIGSLTIGLIIGPYRSLQFGLAAVDCHHPAAVVASDSTMMSCR